MWAWSHILLNILFLKGMSHMSYFKANTTLDTKEDQQIVDLIMKRCQIEASSLELEQEIPSKNEFSFSKDILDNHSQVSNKDIWKNPSILIKEWVQKYIKIEPSKKPDDWLNAKRARALGIIAANIVKIMVVYLFKTFVTLQIDKFSAAKMEKTLENKRVYEFLDKSIQDVYKKHPNYNPMTLNQFKGTGLWEKFKAEFRDKTKNQIIINVADSSFNFLILKLCTRLPLPFLSSFLYIFVIRIMLTYIGCKMGSGSIWDLVVKFNDNIIKLGLVFNSTGFELIKPVLYVTRENNEMVSVKLPEIPRSYYRIKLDEANKILDEYGDDMDLSKLKKEVARRNDLE